MELKKFMKFCTKEKINTDVATLCWKHGIRDAGEITKPKDLKSEDQI